MLEQFSIIDVPLDALGEYYELQIAIIISTICFPRSWRANKNNLSIGNLKGVSEWLMMNA